MTRRNIENARRRAVMLETCKAQTKRAEVSQYIADRIEEGKRAQRRLNIEAAIKQRDTKDWCR
jgi:hypothetical protein